MRTSLPYFYNGLRGFDLSLIHISRYSELKREKAWSRIHLVPMIIAEADRDAYRRAQGQLAREKEIMKDVPDWQVRGAAGNGCQMAALC